MCSLYNHHHCQTHGKKSNVPPITTIQHKINKNKNNFIIINKSKSKVVLISELYTARL